MWLKISLTIASVLASGCTKRYRETESFGAVTVHKDIVVRPLNWEHTGGVERWTIEASGSRLVTDYAQVYAIDGIVVVDAFSEALQNRHVILLSSRTGEPARCADCRCPFLKTPLGPGLRGPLSEWGVASVSYATYPDSNATEVCVIRFDDETFSTRLLAWPASLSLQSLRDRVDSPPLATGCKVDNPGAKLDEPTRYTCELLELTESDARVLKSVQVDTPWYL